MTESTVQSAIQSAVEGLKAELLKQLEGRKHPGFAILPEYTGDPEQRCGPSEVENVVAPTDQNKVGDWAEWQVLMASNTGVSWITRLSALLPTDDIYWVFRRYLGALPIALEDLPIIAWGEADLQSNPRLRFTPSGKMVEVTGTHQCVILSADELTLDSQIRFYIPSRDEEGTREAQILDIEPSIGAVFHRNICPTGGIFSGQETPRYGGARAIGAQQTFYIVVESAVEAPRYIPLARTVKVEGKGDEAVITLELQDGLEAVPYVVVAPVGPEEKPEDEITTWRWRLANVQEALLACLPADRLSARRDIVRCKMEINRLAEYVPSAH